MGGRFSVFYAYKNMVGFVLWGMEFCLGLWKLYMYRKFILEVGYGFLWINKLCTRGEKTKMTQIDYENGMIKFELEIYPERK